MHALALLTLPLLAAAQSCPLQFDGRLPSNFSAAALDANNAFYNPSNVFGKNLTLSQLVRFPDVPGSLFDTGTKPLEVTIGDASIFAPSATNVQTGFRRAELLPASNSGTDNSTVGVKTLHFSVMPDTARPLNTTHEYQLVFLESADFSTNQFVLKTGSILGGTPNTTTPTDLQLYGNVNASPVQLLFSTPFTEGVFSNFAVTLDFDNLTTQVFFSKGNAPLQAVTGPVANDVSGQGQFHFGLLKKPVGGGNDISRSGFQESGIDEGVIYGGIFEEDSTAGCISLCP